MANAQQSMDSEPLAGGMLAFRQQIVVVIAGCVLLGVWFLVPWATLNDAPTLLGIATILSGVSSISATSTGFR